MSKSNLELIQEVFETKLNGINEKIDANNKNLTDKIDTNNKYTIEILTIIKDQTIKTNGNVARHDRELKDFNNKYTEHVLTSATLDQIVEINKKIDKINEENFIVKIWNRYPKALLTIVVISVLLSMATIGYTMITVHTAMRNIKTIERIDQAK